MSAANHLSPRQFNVDSSATDSRVMRTDLAKGEVEGHSEEDYDGVKA